MDVHVERTTWLLGGECWWDGVKWQEWVQGNWLEAPSVQKAGEEGLAWGQGRAGVGVIRGLHLGNRDKEFAGGFKVLGDGKRGLAQG